MLGEHIIRNNQVYLRISSMANDYLGVPIREVYAWAKEKGLEIHKIDGHNYLSNEDVIRASSPYSVYQCFHRSTVFTGVNAGVVVTTNDPVWRDEARIKQLKSAINGLLDAMFTRGEINYHPILNDKVNELTAELKKLEGN